MLAIAGGKGGVGRTTTALGLAAALVGQRRRPLVVDADCGMPNLHALADVPAASGFSAVAAGRPPTDAAVRSGRFPGVDVLPASATADVRRALVALPANRPVLVDCPAGAGRPAALPVRLADGALVVTTPTPAAVADAVKTATVARTVGTPVVGAVVVGTTDPPAGLAAALDAPVLAAVPSAAGRPLDDPAVTSAYDRLAAAVGDEIADEKPGADGRRTAGVRPGNA